jgi:hypothetical protein
VLVSRPGDEHREHTSGFRLTEFLDNSVQK